MQRSKRVTMVLLLMKTAVYDLQKCQGRVFAYIRVSTSEQVTEGFSIEAQRHNILEAMRQEGKAIVKEYVDAGISGSSLKNRKGMLSLMEDARLGLFDELVVWKLSRVSRCFSDLLTILSHLEKHNVRIRSISSENFDSSTPKGKFMAHMLGAVSELEAQGIGENVRNSKIKRVKQGFIHGEVPQGYRREKNGGYLKVYEPEAQLVRRIFKLYRDGNGYKKIAGILLDENIMTPKGKKYSPSSIRRILTQVVYNGFATIKDSQMKMTILARGNFTPIIDVDLWFEVQQRRVENKTERSESKGHLLNGLLRCPVCSQPMYVHTKKITRKNGSVKWYPYYECSQVTKFGNACSSNLIPKETVEKAFVDELMGTLRKAGFIDELTDRVNKIHADQSGSLQNLDSLKLSKRDCSYELTKLFETFEIDAISVDEFSARVKELNDRLQSIEEEIVRLSYKKREQESLLVAQVDVERMAVGLLSQFADKDHTKIRQVMKLLVARIEVNIEDFSEVSIAFNDEAVLVFLKEDIVSL